jgi:YidC/Oxa1 family membrane protein insertase
MQRQMMMIMPLIFTFMFFNFPSGLVLYWLVSNLLGITQQYLMLRSTK